MLEWRSINLVRQLTNITYRDPKIERINAYAKEWEDKYKSFAIFDLLSFEHMVNPSYIQTAKAQVKNVDASQKYKACFSKVNSNIVKNAITKSCDFESYKYVTYR